MKDTKNAKIKILIYYIIIVGITLLVCIPYLRMQSIATIDEFVSMAIPYHYAGANWEDLMAGLTWHGYGITIILTPFLKFVSPRVALILFYSLNIVVRLISTLLTFFISSYVCKLKPALSFIVTLVVAFGFLGNCLYGETNILQELPLVMFLVIISILCFSGEVKWYKYAIASVICGYLVLLHSRYIVVFFCIVCLILFRTVFEKKYIKETIVFCVLIGVMYLFFSRVNHYVNGEIFSKASDSTRNTIESMTTSSSFLKHWNKMKQYGFMEYVRMFFALNASFTFWSFGLIWVSIISIVHSIVNKIKNKNSFKTEQWIGIFGCMMYIIMNVLLTPQAMGGGGEKLYRNYMLIRYAIPFTWLINLSGLIILVKGQIDKRKLFILSGIISIALEMWFIFKYTHWFDDSGYTIAKSPFRYFLFTDGFEWELCSEYFSFLLKITLLVFVIAIMLNEMSKIKMMAVVYLILSAMYLVGNYNYFIDRTTVVVPSLIQNSKEILANVLDDGNDIDIIYSGDDFYCMMLRLEYPFEDIKYYKDLSEYDFSKDYILFTNNEYDEMQDDCYHQSSKEYIYSNVYKN